MVETLLLIAYTAAAGILSWLLVCLLFDDRPSWWRLAVAVALLPVLIAFELTALGALGWLAPHVGGVIMAVLALAIWIAGRRRPSELPRAGPIPEGLSRESAVALAALIGVVLPPVARALLAGPQFGYDDYSYHAPFVTQWMLDGRISVLPFNYHAYFPFNAELFALWFMLPVGSDTFVGMGGAYWTIAVPTAVTALALSLGRRVEGALLAAALVAVSTLVVITALRFSANDLAGTVMISSALVVLSGTGAVRERRVAELLVAGMFIGFGLGAKLTMLPAVVVLLAWIAFDARGGRTVSVRLVHMGLFALGIVLSTGYWYGRNWFLTGNPFFPGAIGFFDGPLGFEERDQTKLMTFLLTDPVGTLRIGLPALTNWPFILWLVATAGYVRGIVMLFRKSASKVPSAQAVEAALLLIGLSLLLTFPLQPFSGTTNQPGAPLTPEPRFLIISFMAGVVVASRWIDGARAVLVAAAIVVGAGLIGNLPAGVMAAILALVTWFAPRLLEAMVHFIRAHRIVTLAVLTAALAVGALLWRGNLEKAIERRVFSFRSAGQMMGPLWKEVNDLPAGSKVVAFGLAGSFSYPLYGRSLELRPVMLDRSGGPLQPVHAVWLAAPNRFRWWASQPDSSELAGLREGLLSGDVTHVAVSRTGSGTWPVQTGILLPPHFTVIHSDPGSALYRVNH